MTGSLKLSTPISGQSGINTAMGTSISGGKKPRKKHKNSKSGCVQCKERRMKCNEELPECRNCRIRQVKIPCSYLSFTEDERDAFIKTKEANCRTTVEQKSQSQKNQYASELSSSTSSPEVSPIVNRSSHQSPKTTYTFKSIIHAKLKPMLQSQMIRFVNESDDAFKTREYFYKMLNDSFFRFDESFTSHFALTAFWIHVQLKRKYNIIKRSGELDEDDENELDLDMESLYAVGIKYLHIGVSVLRNIVDSLVKANEVQDFKTAFYLFGKMAIYTVCLQTSDIIRKNTLRAFFFDGSLSVVNEFFKKAQDATPLAKFAGKTAGHVQKSLFIPNYPHQVLYEIRDTLKDFKLCVDTREPHDLILRENVSTLISFIEEDILVFLEKNEKSFPANSIITHTPKWLFSVLFKFYNIIPSESFTIDTTASSIHKVFYTFYYAIGRTLDNILPDTRYIAQYRFIGPTTVYPFEFAYVRRGLDPELLFFANYFLRILSFFTRRADFFGKQMIVLNPFPENLDENRFCSRRAKVQETFISHFKNTAIKNENYPYVNDTRFSAHTSPNSPVSSDSSFSTNFNTIFATNFNFESNFQKFSISNIDQPLSVEKSYMGLRDSQPPFMDGKGLYRLDENNHPELDFLDTVSDSSGFLTVDYDPVLFDWVDFDKKHADTDIMSLQKYLEDREILMKYFTAR